MSDQDIFYDFSGIDETSQTINSQCQELESLLDSITNDVNDLVESWDGAGKEGWYQVQTQWDTTAQAEKDSLGEIHTALGQDSEGMQSCDAEVAAMFN